MSHADASDPIMRRLDRLERQNRRLRAVLVLAGFLLVAGFGLNARQPG